MVEKLNIQPQAPSALAQKYPTGISVPFNPNAYTISKSVMWGPPPTDTSAASSGGGAAAAPGGAGGGASSNGPSNRELDAPPTSFNGGGGRTLVLRLFFDVSEQGPGADVRTNTDQLVELTRIQQIEGKKVGRPPVCKVSWGSQVTQDFPFVGVVTSLTQNFVYFESTGQPLRANVDITFTEFIDPEANKKQTDPDFTTYVVRRGDTLSAIAARLYRNPALWRVIADANGIDDPKHLTIGARLAIPALAISR
jgi:nucleoid-associated protein YgaU